MEERVFLVDFNSVDDKGVVPATFDESMGLAIGDRVTIEDPELEILCEATIVDIHERTMLIRPIESPASAYVEVTNLAVAPYGDRMSSFYVPWGGSEDFVVLMPTTVG